jgi:hypothetical protein
MFINHKMESVYIYKVSQFKTHRHIKSENDLYFLHPEHVEWGVSKICTCGKCSTQFTRVELIRVESGGSKHNNAKNNSELFSEQHPEITTKEQELKDIQDMGLSYQKESEHLIELNENLKKNEEVREKYISELKEYNKESKKQLNTAKGLLNSRSVEQWDDKQENSKLKEQIKKFHNALTILTQENEQLKNQRSAR